MNWFKSSKKIRPNEEQVEAHAKALEGKSLDELKELARKFSDRTLAQLGVHLEASHRAHICEYHNGVGLPDGESFMDADAYRRLAQRAWDNFQDGFGDITTRGI